MNSFFKNSPKNHYILSLRDKNNVVSDEDDIVNRLNEFLVNIDSDLA